MTPTRHSIPVPNTVGEKGAHQIVFYDWGNPDAATITICVHGLTRNARDFDFLVRERPLEALHDRVLLGRAEARRDPPHALQRGVVHVDGCEHLIIAAVLAAAG